MSPSCTNKSCLWYFFSLFRFVVHVFQIVEPPKMRVLWELHECLQFCTTLFSLVTSSELIMFCRILTVKKTFRFCYKHEMLSKQVFFDIFDIFVIIQNFVLGFLVGDSFFQKVFIKFFNNLVLEKYLLIFSYKLYDWV